MISEDGSCTDPSNGCVPLNVWGNDIGAEAADFIRLPEEAGRSVTENEQTVFMATVSGNTSEWFTIPGDPGPIGLVFGLEYREIKTLIETSSIIEQQQFMGFARAPFSLDDGIDDFSFFGEALVPLIAGKPGIDFLELELGWRFSDHSQTGNDSTYKIAVSYYPNPEWHIRAHIKSDESPINKGTFSYSEFNGGSDPCIFRMSSSILFYRHQRGPNP